MTENGSRQPPAKASGGPARVWAILGRRHGDNGQVLALARGLGVPFEEIRLAYNALYNAPNRLLGASLASVTRAERPQLHDRSRKAWPDLVIAAGRRSVPVALWIKARAGGRTKIVQIGRPRAPLDRFDLVVTTPQYGLPQLANVETLPLPLTLSPEDAPPANGLSADWDKTFAGLARPWTGILIGGSTWPFKIDAAAAKRLAADIDRWLTTTGGSALITTSPRTGASAAQALGAALNSPHHLHRWRSEGPNPYRAIIELADDLIVTSDSVSMLADACRTRKPVALWRAPVRSDPASRIGLSLGRQAGNHTSVGRLLRWSAARGIATPPRHVASLSDAVVGAGLAHWFAPDESQGRPQAEDGAAAEDRALARIVARVRRLSDL